MYLGKCVRLFGKCCGKRAHTRGAALKAVYKRHKELAVKRGQTQRIHLKQAQRLSDRSSRERSALKLRVVARAFKEIVGSTRRRATALGNFLDTALVDFYIQDFCRA